MKRLLPVLIPIVVLVVLAAVLLYVWASKDSERRNSRATLEYSQDGLSFTYPEVWEKSSDEGFDSFRMVLLSTPNDAICIIQADEVQPGESLMDVAMTFSSEAEFDEGLVRSADTSFTRPEVEEGFERVDELCQIKAIGVKVPLRRAYYRKVFGDRSVTIIFQTEVPVPPGLMRGLDLIKGSISVSEPGG